jgi:hypothetical protein
MMTLGLESLVMRVVIALSVALVISGCAIQRAQMAGDAKVKMIGKTKEQVLACMGVPTTKAVEGTTEVWSYNSGNGQTVGFGTSSANVFGSRGYASGYGTSTVVTEQRFCTVNVTMVNGSVDRLNYVGPTGGLLTQGEQCAFVLQNCLQQ